VNLTLDQLRMIAPKTPASEVEPIKASMVRASIDTPLRAAAYLAQHAEECCEFTVHEEIWGPTAAQTLYEPPSLLSKRLGNIYKGDGYLFRGRGGIQLTGRLNYKLCGADLGVDLEGSPDLAATPEYRYLVSAWFWTKHQLNALADDGDVIGMRRAINGPGLYGLRQVQDYYTRALPALGATPACGVAT